MTTKNKTKQPQKVELKPATVGLSIIVKNESAVIERMLKSVAPMLDYYCVIDTGSTDGTQDIIRKFFEERGIPGEVIDHPWKNFQDARNKALQSVKGKADFGFWIDADEELLLEPNFNPTIFKSNLGSVDGANVKISYGGQNYYRMQFFKTDVEWYWYGPVHEVLMCDSPAKVATAEGAVVLVRPDGNSWVAETIQQKYENHAKILEDYVANDPKKDPRWLFYLAQSYRDTGTEEGRKKSIEWYEKRRDAQGGYWEEIYYSALMVANLKVQLNHPIEECISSFIACGKYNQYRAEHLLPIIAYYHNLKDFETAYIFGKRAMEMAGKAPTNTSSLFIDEETYTWKIYDVHCLSCWYAGRKEEGVQAFRKLLDKIRKGQVPQEHIPRINENKKYFINNK
jgi:glycosyltransferase involved in cell wall biosynthesis